MIIKRLFLTSCFFSFFPVWLNAQVSQDWIAVSPGPHVEINYEPKPNSRSLNLNKLAINNQNNLFTVHTSMIVQVFIMFACLHLMYVILTLFVNL